VFIHPSIRTAFFEELNGLAEAFLSFRYIPFPSEKFGIKSKVSG